MKGKSLFDFPIHLGMGAKAVAEPEFTGPEWYDEYVERHGDDLDEGRIVSLFRFEESWSSWEVHPFGDEVVCVIQGYMTLLQELPDGSQQSHEVADAFRSAFSKGIYFNTRIRDHFPYREIAREGQATES